MATELPSGIIIPLGGRILMKYSKDIQYNEHRYVDEFDNVTAQTVGHGWGAPANGLPSKYHGHWCVYAVNPSDPGGNNRHEAITVANAVHDPMDPPGAYLRNEVGFNHDSVNLEDSRLRKQNEVGVLAEIYVDHNFNVKARPAQALPPPSPITGPNFEGTAR